jgi:CheY-like chemotaxis protein
MHKILVVDDQADIQRLLVMTLQDEFEVVTASDGKTALALARELRPKAILLDVMMPGDLDGLQVLDILKAEPGLEHVPVAMLTARAQMSDWRGAMERKADAYFTKPFSPLAVLGWIRANAGSA